MLISVVRATRVSGNAGKCEYQLVVLYCVCTVTSTSFSLPGSLTVIGAKAVSSMLSLTFRGYNQLVYPIFYLMLLVMVVTAIGQIK